MKTNQAVKLLGVLTLCALLTSLSGCYFVAQNEAQKTQLQVRAFQTRTYKTTDVDMVMKACLNVLQDEGYAVKNVVPQIGLLVAEKAGKNDSFGEWFWFGISVKNLEATVNVAVVGKETKVRANFIEKKNNIYGGQFTANPIDDEKFYQDFFAKVDKGIFIQKEGI